MENINNIVKLLPDYRPKYLKQTIEKKCQVLHYPIVYPDIKICPVVNDNILHVIWPHRWEFDKGPEDFFKILYRLKEENIPFRLSILGERFKDVPQVFHDAKLDFQSEIVNYGFIDNKDDYYKVLKSGNVVVSTAKHEFFGVAL